MRYPRRPTAGGGQIGPGGAAATERLDGDRGRIPAIFGGASGAGGRPFGASREPNKGADRKHSPQARRNARRSEKQPFPSLEWVDRVIPKFQIGSGRKAPAGTLGSFDLGLERKSNLMDVVSVVSTE